jgi:hypothetical protein
MMVVIGYDEGGGQQTVLCVNPRPFAHTDYWLVPLEEYTGQPASTAKALSSLYIHEYDYFMITPSP